jgi:hypothetical protein
LDHLADGSTESPEVGSFLVTEKEPRQPASDFFIFFAFRDIILYDINHP